MYSKDTILATCIEAVKAIGSLEGEDMFVSRSWVISQIEHLRDDPSFFEAYLPTPNCECTDGTDPDEPADRGYICPHDVRGIQSINGWQVLYGQTLLQCAYCGLHRTDTEDFSLCDCGGFFPSSSELQKLPTEEQLEIALLHGMRWEESEDESTES